ncbi:MAG TPA: hypothetical protein VNF75_03880, partial [Candidatus Dormibacteraeota bacterium]|nr:hypothetical protein [Candidatus Dormibacteraeota bacterium]
RVVGTEATIGYRTAVDNKIYCGLETGGCKRIKVIIAEIGCIAPAEVFWPTTLTIYWVAAAPNPGAAKL